MKIVIPMQKSRCDFFYDVVDHPSASVCAEALCDHFDFPPFTKRIDLVVSDRKLPQSYRIKLPYDRSNHATIEYAHRKLRIYLLLGMRQYIKNLGLGGKTVYVSVQY